MDVLHSVITGHESGIHLITSPTYATGAEMLTEDLFGDSMTRFRSHDDCIVAALPHDFSEVALAELNAPDVIDLLCAPEMAPIRAVAAALDTCTRLG